MRFNLLIIALKRVARYRARTGRDASLAQRQRTPAIGRGHRRGSRRLTSGPRDRPPDRSDDTSVGEPPTERMTSPEASCRVTTTPVARARVCRTRPAHPGLRSASRRRIPGHGAPGTGGGGTEGDGSARGRRPGAVRRRNGTGLARAGPPAGRTTAGWAGWARRPRVDGGAGARAGPDSGTASGALASGVAGDGSGRGAGRPADAERQHHAGRPGEAGKDALLPEDPKLRAPTELAIGRDHGAPRRQPSQQRRGPVAKGGNAVPRVAAPGALGQVALDLDAPRAAKRLIEICVQFVFRNV